MAVHRLDYLTMQRQGEPKWISYLLNTPCLYSLYCLSPCTHFFLLTLSFHLEKDVFTFDRHFCHSQMAMIKCNI